MIYCGPYNRIHILGASGSGTTSLASALCKDLPHEHIDSDDYFWHIKYSAARPREKRLDLLERALNSADQWILSGAVIDWGNPLIPLFDLVIFLYVPHDIRISRLREREKQRYGESILPGNEKHTDFEGFIEWASSYENGGIEIRSRLQQETWLKGVACPILRIEGDSPIEANTEVVLKYLRPK